MANRMGRINGSFVPAGHFHSTLSSSVDRAHAVATPVAGTAGFSVVFQRREEGAAPLTVPGVFLHDTVLTLQKKVFAASNIAPAQQHLESPSGTRMATGNVRDYGVGPGCTIRQAALVPPRPSGVPATPQVPKPRTSEKPPTPPPTTPRDGLDLSAKELAEEISRSETLRYDPSWQNRTKSPRSSQPVLSPAATPGGTLSPRRAMDRPPTATERAVASRRGSPRAMPWSGQYKATSSQNFGTVNPSPSGAAATLTPRHYGNFPPTVRAAHVPMAGGRGGAPQVEQITHSDLSAGISTAALNDEDHVAVALQPDSDTHTANGARIPTASKGGAPPTPFTPKELSAGQEYYAIKWGAQQRGAQPNVQVDGRLHRK